MIEIVRTSRALIFDGEGDKLPLVSSYEVYRIFEIMKHQRGLLIARKDLVTKVKGSVQKPAVTRLFFYSNFPSINGLIGTWSLLILSLLNMSADCKDSSISILLFVIISTLALAVHLSLIFYGLYQSYLLI